MDKTLLLHSIITELEQEVATLTTAAQASFESATDEESRAESKYDTRSLETSYLASGQARLAVEAQEALARFKTLPLKNFSTTDEIAMSALIKVQTGGKTHYYFLGPSSGGVEVEHAGKTVMIITPQSPIGKSLIGKKQGDAFQMKIGRNQESITVASVQ